MNEFVIIPVIISGFLFSSGLVHEYKIEIPADRIQIVYDELSLCIPPHREVPEQWQSLFHHASADAGLPPEVLEAVAWAESGFKPLAVSPKRKDGHFDQGMFQFNSRYQNWYEEKYNTGKPFDPMNPQEAIKIAALHVKWLYERYRHWPYVFMAYNAGIHAVDTGEIPGSAWDYLIKIYRAELKGGADHAAE